jgi:putative FmdB family regulatory protein
MPSYDFVCRKCNAEFDEVLSIAQRDTAVHCPDCGASAKRQISAPYFPGTGGDAYDWSSENGGKGRRISQMDPDTKTPYYARSRQQIHEDGKRRGLKVINA